MADSRRRPRLPRIRELPAVWRWAITAVIAGFAVAPAVAAAAGLHQGWQPTGDVAIIGVRSLDAWTRHAPLVGQPTTGGLYASRPSFHPGPIEYWWLGPWIRLLGARVGMVLAIALLNGAALAGILWLAFRRGERVLLAFTALALAAVVRSLGAQSLFDPFNSEVATFPALLAVFAAWSILVGDRQMVIVLAAAVAVAAQVHSTSAAMLLPVVVVAVVVFVRDGDLRRRDRQPALVAAAITLVCWLPVALREVVGPSNLVASYRTATATHPRMGLAFALDRLALALAPPPLFTRIAEPAGFLATPGTVGLVLAAILGGGMVSLALLSGRNRSRRPQVRFVVVILLVTGAALLTTADGPPTLGARADANRWMWQVGVLFWLAAAWFGWQLLPAGTRARFRLGVAAGVASLAAVVLVVSLAQIDLPTLRDGRSMAATGALVDATLHRLPAGSYHVTWQGLVATFNVGPSLVYRLEADGHPVVLDGNPFASSYGDQRARSGRRVDGRLRIVTAPSAPARPGETLIARRAIPASDGQSAFVFLAR